MASTIIQRASSSSSLTSSWKYDIFLSFHGEDTRKSFADHLHAAMKKSGILVFRDDEKLEQEKYVWEELLKAIQESKYAIIVISPNYAFSRWCLNELSKIVECMRGKERILPIFYHVDPSDVRNQKGTFKEAFVKHEASLREKKPNVDIKMMHKWRTALEEVGKITGWHVHNSYESKVVEEIIVRVKRANTFKAKANEQEFSQVQSRARSIAIAPLNARSIAIAGSSAMSIAIAGSSAFSIAIAGLSDHRVLEHSISPYL